MRFFWIPVCRSPVEWSQRSKNFIAKKCITESCCSRQNENRVLHIWFDALWCLYSYQHLSRALGGEVQFRGDLHSFGMLMHVYR